MIGRELDDNSYMPFGKYQGKKMANVPASYLLYILDNYNLNNPWGRSVKRYIKSNIEHLTQESKSNK